MNKKYLLYFPIIIILFSNCSKTHCTGYCFDDIVLMTVGYDSSEVDSIIVKTFWPDNTFLHQVDSFNVIGKTMYQYHNLNSDSINIYDHQSSDTSIRRIFDYEVILPSQNRTYKVSNITYGGNSSNDVSYYPGMGPDECSDLGLFCQQYLVSYQLNGSTINFKSNSNTQGFI